mmetsp:Transcript_61697/g.151865  ORF Transcript_61697/g.151865 Transcript_61697/m.151865 type:complete len:338 (+) Transcript_61697:167-1180(+)
MHRSDLAQTLQILLIHVLMWPRELHRGGGAPEQHPHALRHALGRHRHVVPALERTHHLPRRCNVHHKPCHACKRAWFERKAAQGVAVGGIEARRHEHKVGSEGRRDRSHEPAHGEVVDGVTRVAHWVLERDVDRVPAPRALPDLVECPRSREEVGLLKPASVHRDVEHIRVIVKDVLHPVPVVHIPIKDEDLLGAELAACLTRRDGHVVVEAEAHGVRAHRVVPGGAHHAEAVLGLPSHHLCRHLRHAPRSHAGGKGAAIGIEVCGGIHHCLPSRHSPHVRLIMHPQQLIVCGLPAVHDAALVDEALFDEGLPNARGALLLLGVAAGVVDRVPLVVH